MIFGKKINEINFLGVNVYDYLKSSFPDFSSLKDVGEKNKELIAFLRSDDFSELSDSFLGEYSAPVKDLANDVVNIATAGEDGLEYVIDVLNQLSALQAQIKTAIISAEKAISTIDTIALLFVLHIVAFIIVYIVGKGPKYLSAIALTPATVIFLLLGIAILVGNSAIANAIASTEQSISQELQKYIMENMQEVYYVSTMFIDWDNAALLLKVSLHAGIGWWLMTISLLFINVSAYVIPNKKFNAWYDGRTAENTTEVLTGENPDGTATV